MGKNFRKLELKSSYETGEDDLLEEFYAPILKCAASYDRIAGFFSSSSLAVAARGIAEFIRNGGKMRLIACPRLEEEDVKVMELASISPEKFFEEKLENVFDELEDAFQEDHIMALGWMLANDFLEIRLAVVNFHGRFCTVDEIEKSGIFHQKVGIFTDSSGDKISFSGSINETASGWLYNIEEFKVFRSWTEERKYLDKDEEKFRAFWGNTRKNVTTYTLPESIKKKIIEKARSFSLEKIIIENYRKYLHKKEKIDLLGLFFYQRDAVEKWKNNDFRLLFQMATGTGKTRTALGCMAQLMTLTEKLIVITACPQGTLSLQWKKEIEDSPLEFEASAVIDGTNRKWKDDLEEMILRVTIGYYNHVIIFTTHATGAKEEFMDMIHKSSDSISYLFIGDEAHGLGAAVTRNALLERYDYRVGLSATPGRWFDEGGTQILENYFGGEMFEFSINDALTTINPMTGKTFLVPYTYHLEFVDLTEDELAQYSKISKEVHRMGYYSKESDEYAKRLERLLFKRADIVKNAANKYEKLKQILHSMDQIQDLIIFVSPEQIDCVLEIMYEMRIPSHSFTMDTGTTAESKYDGLTERQHVIECFKTGYYKALIAIKCLDEGIDIPSAQNAILMASSTNPREYIQRIGRIIRQAPGKTEAKIWDITIRPCHKNLAGPELQEFEKMIWEKEKFRIYDILENAQNNAEALKTLYGEMGD